MQFNSLEYGLLLLATWVAFQGIRGRPRIGLLIASSFLFYASWKPIAPIEGRMSFHVHICGKSAAAIGLWARTWGWRKTGARSGR